MIAVVLSMLSLPSIAEQKRFGDNLFTGSFSKVNEISENKNYILQPGDEVQIRTWGALSLNLLEVVDSRGVIFIDQVGAIDVSGIKYGGLNNFIKTVMHREYSTDVKVYASLKNYKKINIFISGMANSPGVYSGATSDSILSFLDRAKGIGENGSYTDIDIIRNSKNIGKVNLYKYIKSGEKPIFRLRNGDVIHINPLKREVIIEGLDGDSVRYEIINNKIDSETIASITGYFKKLITIEKTTTTRDGIKREVIELSKGDSIKVKSGDIVKVLPAQETTDIVVEIKNNATNATIKKVMSPGSTLHQLFLDIGVNNGVSKNNSLKVVRLYRESVKEQQVKQYKEYASRVRRMALMNQANTKEISLLAKSESDRLTLFADKIEHATPQGSIVISYDEISNVILEDGDRIEIPVRPTTVSVNGSVMFPNTYIHKEGVSVSEYIRKSGNISEDSGNERVLLKHHDGSVIVIDMESINNCFLSCDGGEKVYPGDEILVIPGTMDKSWQYSKEILSILYQLAVSARVFL